MIDRDVETRARLLGAAATLFAARGFKDVTVREICRAAGANVASVNYHFRGKLGLYREVLNKAIDTMRTTTAAAREAGGDGPAVERLRAYVRVFVRRVGRERQDSWIHRLMVREIADPTPALDRIADEVITPRVRYLSEVIGEIIGRAPNDEVVGRCVLSLQAQCHAAMPHPFAAKYAHIKISSDADLDRLADHIVEFSLGGIGAVGARPDHLRQGYGGPPKPSAKAEGRTYVEKARRSRAT